MDLNKKAIEKGLQLILVIDENDPSINYKHAGIDNCYLQQAVDLKGLSDLLFDDGVPYTGIDSTGVVSFILADGQEILLHQYRKGLDVKFLRITNKILSMTYNDILISMNKTHGIYKMSWQEDKTYTFFDKTGYYTQGQDIDQWSIQHSLMSSSDISGYDKCVEINNTANDVGIKCPAIQQALEYRNNVGQHEYRGYLPSIGQLMIIMENRELINFLLKLAGTNIIPVNKRWWSCSEAWKDISLMYYNGCSFYFKTSSLYCLPIFKQIR